jgi:NitT/TauT family transport system ATP-binding protein
MIDIRGLNVTYKNGKSTTLALQNINISIAKGEICAFLGPSGCGKSTLLHVLSGIIKDYEGSVLIGGEPVDAKKQRIGLIMQEYGLLPWKCVYDNAVLGLKIKGISLKENSQYIDYVLDKCGLTSLKSRFPGELSGGQRQRVAIARSFILKPDILLMDEPFSALDAITREGMQELFLEIWKESGVSTVFITHSIEEAAYVGRKVAVFSHAPGRIVRIIDNPLSGRQDLRLREEYYKFSLELRKLLKEDSKL